MNQNPNQNTGDPSGPILAFASLAGLVAGGIYAAAELAALAVHHRLLSDVDSKTYVHFLSQLPKHLGNPRQALARWTVDRTTHRTDRILVRLRVRLPARRYVRCDARSSPRGRPQTSRPGSTSTIRSARMATTSNPLRSRTTHRHRTNTWPHDPRNITPKTDCHRRPLDTTDQQGTYTYR
jgi:hypothetical protein